MSSSYDRNIQRLKRTQETNLRRRRENTRERIKQIDNQVDEQVSNISKATDLLVGKKFGSPNIASGEGGILPYKHVKYIQEQDRLGIEAEKQDRIANVKRLKDHFTTLDDADTAAHIVKKQALINGAFYHEASRFTELSPHAQVSYARRKLALYKESEEDKLKYWQTKNGEKFKIKGIDGEFIPTDVFANNLYPPDIKQALLELGIEEIRAQNGINGFSKEMLELEGVDDYIGEDGQLALGSSSKAIEASMATIRKNWNVESSMRDTEKYISEFISNIPNGTASINKLFHELTSLVSKDNVQRSGTEVWESIIASLASELVLNPDFDLEDLDLLFEEIDPNTISKKNPKGLPYSHNSSHADKLLKIRNKYEQMNTANLNAEENLLKMDSREYLIDITRQRKDPNSALYKLIEENGGITDAMVKSIYRVWQSKGGENDGNMPKLLANILTKEEQAQDEIKDRVRDAMLTRGWVTAFDIENATPETIKELKQELGNDIFSRSIINATMSGKQFEDDYQVAIDAGIKEYFDLEGEDKPWNYAEVYGNLEREWVNRYQYYLGEKHSPAEAADLATKELQHKMGLRVNDAGQLPEQQDIDEFFTPKPWTKPLDNRSFQKKLNSAKDKYDQLIRDKDAGKRTDLLGEDTLIFKKSSKEFQSLVEFADTEGKKGKVNKLLIELARLYPEFTWEDLVNQQLIAGGHTGLPKYSSFQQAMSVSDLAEWKRLIGYKSGPIEVVQAKVVAVDNSEVEEVVEEEEPYDWEAEAIKAAGPPPVKPEEGKLNSRGKPSRAHVKAMEQYEKDLAAYNATVAALTPATLSQGEPLTRTRKERVGQGGSKNIFEFYWNGEWRQMDRKQYELLIETVRKFGGGNFNYQDYDFIPNETGGFDIKKKESYLTSYWNIPGSPVLNPLVAEYASELYTANTISV